jgi:hypothetical protein
MQVAAAGAGAGRESVSGSVAAPPMVNLELAPRVRVIPDGGEDSEYPRSVDLSRHVG